MSAELAERRGARPARDRHRRRACWLGRRKVARSSSSCAGDAEDAAARGSAASTRWWAISSIDHLPEPDRARGGGPRARSRAAPSRSRCWSGPDRHAVSGPDRPGDRGGEVEEDEEPRGIPSGPDRLPVRRRRPSSGRCWSAPACRTCRRRTVERRASRSRTRRAVARLHGRERARAPHFVAALSPETCQARGSARRARRGSSSPTGARRRARGPGPPRDIASGAALTSSHLPSVGGQPAADELHQAREPLADVLEPPLL